MIFCASIILHNLCRMCACASFVYIILYIWCHLTSHCLYWLLNITYKCIQLSPMTMNAIDNGNDDWYYIILSSFCHRTNVHAFGYLLFFLFCFCFFFFSYVDWHTASQWIVDRHRIKVPWSMSKIELCVRVRVCIVSWLHHCIDYPYYHFIMYQLSTYSCTLPCGMLLWTVRSKKVTSMNWMFFFARLNNTNALRSSNDYCLLLLCS